MEHLALEVFDLQTDNRETVGSKFAALQDNTPITFTDTSELFASGDVWSQSFTLNMRANAHIFGTAQDMHGQRLHDLIDHRRARLWLEGLPMYLGYLRLESEAEVDTDGNVDVSFESGQKTFEEMIDGAKASQVPTIGDVEIGMALWRKRRTHFKVKITASAAVLAPSLGNVKVHVEGPVKHYGSEDEWFEFMYDGEEDGNSVQEYPRMVFPKGHFRSWQTGVPDWDEDCLNTDYPYNEDANGTPTHPYCNIALCYQKSGYEHRDEDGNVKTEYGSEPEAQRGYEYMPANRVNSAPCFYVIYWIRCLMNHLGIYIEENQMMGVEDLRRLFFVNTKCDYVEPKKLRSVDYSERFGRYFDEGYSVIPIVPEYIDPDKNVSYEKSGFAGVNAVFPYDSTITVEAASGISLKINDVEDWTDDDIKRYRENNNYFHKAYATSECFPAADISEVIKAIESGFGVRFLFSGDYRRVRIVLLRNIFRSGDVQQVECDIVSESKVENCIRGFRMTYGESEDTHFYYKGFADMLPHKTPYFKDNSDKHDYSFWDLNADYSQIINKVSAFDKTCYVTPDTGNAYGIKVDKDAKRFDELHPALYEFAGFMDAEDGDCTGDDETIETVNVGFKPAIMNDLNMEEERSRKSAEQRFALFADDTMRPRRPDLGDLEAPKSYNDADARYSTDKLFEKYGPNGTDSNMSAGGTVKPGEFAIQSDMYAYTRPEEQQPFSATSVMTGSWLIWTIGVSAGFDIEGHIYEGYRLYLQDNYEPNDDGVCPIENHDWGLMLGIMRGSGSDAYVNYEADPDDGEGNDTWDIMAGSNVTAHPDTCDSYGKEWDYNMARSVSSPQAAAHELEVQFPNSNARFNIDGWDRGWISGADIISLPDDNSRFHNILIASKRGDRNLVPATGNYISSLANKSVQEMMEIDGAYGSPHIIVEIDSNMGRRDTLLELCDRAYNPDCELTSDMIIDGSGVGSRYGRFSLKLRSEKLNPYYNPDSTDPDEQRQYLEIEDENLRGRGLLDTFYKEYSYFIRHARIAKRTVKMELAQFLAIDKTKKVKVGDICGFLRKKTFTVSKETGLGQVELEIMYI